MHSRGGRDGSGWERRPRSVRWDWSHVGVLVLAVLTALPARAGTSNGEQEAGATGVESRAGVCSGTVPAPGLTFTGDAPRTCRLRGVLLTGSASPAPASGVRLTDLPAGTPERDQLLMVLNTERIAMNWMAVKVLAGWTLANMAVGTAGYFIADDRTWRSFHQMNALFNVPILGTAVVGALILAAQDPERLDLKESLRRGVMLERGLLVGVTLDVLAAGFGAFLWERGRRIDSGQLTGWGRSLLFQGTALLLFDSTLLLLNARYDARLLMMLSPDPREPTGVALRMRF